MKKKNSNKHLLITISTWLVLIAIWHIVTEYKIVSSVTLPSPKMVVIRFIDMLKTGYNGISLFAHVYMSLKRLFIAIFFAIITAVPLGLLSGYFPKVRAITDSLVNFYRPIPPLGYYTLLVLWMGIYDSSKIMLLYLAAFAPIYLVCASSVGDVKEDYILSAISLGASKKDIFYRVMLPASLPRIITGIRTAIGFSYTTLVSAEMVAAKSGVGWMVIDASRYIKVDVIFVGIIIMGVTGILIDYVIRKIEERYVFWKGK